jgi:hypothetical protein
MCMLCDDEKAYQAYMNYVDAMERQGKDADPDKAIDAVLDELEAKVNAENKARATNNKKQNKFFADDATDDKTLSPFFCSPINK